MKINNNIHTIVNTVAHKTPTVAVIKEDECIGCFKCINACPVDAIVGSPQRMHTVITANCIGCDLCITACPVNCISAQASLQTPNLSIAINRNTDKLHRLETLSDYEKSIYLQYTFQDSTDPIADKKAAIAAAVKRANNKKN
jgi:electron transport complex protein RnfB